MRITNYDNVNKMISITNKIKPISSQFNLFHEWKFGTLNIRSGKEKLEGARMYEITKEVARANLTFCILQEVRHRNTGKKVIELNNGERYNFLWCGKKKRRDAGVGVLIRSERGVTFTEPDFNDPRVMALNINIHGFKTRVVIGYSPTNVNESEPLKDEFYRNLKKASALCPKHHKLIVAGDFNAETSIVYEKHDYDGKTMINDEICNENGIRLKSFSRAHKLCMPQSFFKKELINRYTWYSSDGRTKKILDYIMLQRFMNQYVIDCEVKPEYKFESDHRLLETKLLTPRNKSARWKPKSIPKPKLNENLLSDSNYTAEYVSKSSNYLKLAQTLINDSAEEISNRLIKSLKQAASEVLPVQQVKEVNQIWRDDAKLNSLLSEKSLAEPKSIEHKKLCRSIKSRIRKLRNDKVRAEADELNTFATKREIESLYKAFKNDGSTFKQVKSKEGCEPHKLKKYFEEHFSEPDNKNHPIELSNAPDFIQNLKELSDIGEINSEPPNRKEIISTLKHLKNGKASNDIKTIYLKSAVDSKEVVDEIVKLYDTIWHTEYIPKKWCHSKLLTIWKGAAKGKVSDPSAYRGIQIGSTFCKILVIIILDRIRNWYEKQLLDQQQGFRKGRGTTDGIYVIKRVQQISYRSRKPLYALFVDLSAAFDHVNRDWLFKTLYQRLPANKNKKLFKLLESVYSFTTTGLSDNEKDIFNVLVGVRQGGPESPTLYNLYMDYVMRVYLKDCKVNGVKFTKFNYKIPKAALIKPSMLGKCGENCINWVGYADDIVLIFDDQSNLKKALELLNYTFKRYQLNINAKKTETMIFNFNGPEDSYPKTICKLDEHTINNVKMFKYLGANIQYKDAATGDAEINQRLDSAEAKFYEHSKKLMNFQISLRTRTLILNALVRSRQTYGCQVWTLTMEQKRRMNSFYCGLLRRMVRGGFKRKEGSMAFVKTNKEILELCKTEQIETFIFRQQRRYLAHIIRQEDNSLVKTLTFNNDQNHVPGPYTTLKSSVLSADEFSEIEFYKQAKNRQI